MSIHVIKMHKTIIYPYFEYFLFKHSFHIFIVIYFPLLELQIDLIHVQCDICEKT